MAAWQILFDNSIKYIENLATNPTIQSLVAELNQMKLNSGYDARIEEKRNEFLLQIRPFQESVGYSIGVEDVKIVGKEGTAFLLENLLRKFIHSDDFNQFRSNEEIVQAIINLLDALVDHGSSVAFQLREYIITPLGG